MKMAAMWATALTMGVLGLFAPAVQAASFEFTATDIASDMTDWSVGCFWDYVGAGVPIDYTSETNMMGCHVLTTLEPGLIAGSGLVWTVDDPWAGGGNIGSWASFTVTEDTAAIFNLDATGFVAAQFGVDGGTTTYLSDGQELSLSVSHSYFLYVSADIASYDGLDPLRSTYDFTLQPVPEPISMVMLGCLGGGMALARKLRRKGA